MKKVPGSQLQMPVYVKVSPDMPWPERDKAFYVLARNGLFIGRNHEFFRSCVRAAKCPSELAAHAEFIKLSYPRLERSAYELVVGFFTCVADLHSAEAIVLLAWDRDAGRTVLLVPEQHSYVARNWKRTGFHPLHLRYEASPLPPQLVLIGDIHSHVDGPAYASHTDVADETYRPGLHLVVGRIYKDPPELHIEVAVDGRRFPVTDPGEVIAGYRRRRADEVPQEWLDQVHVKVVGDTWADAHPAANPAPGTPRWNRRPAADDWE